MSNSPLDRYASDYIKICLLNSLLSTSYNDNLDQQSNWDDAGQKMRMLQKQIKLISTLIIEENSFSLINAHSIQIE